LIKPNLLNMSLGIANVIHAIWADFVGHWMFD